LEKHEDIEVEMKDHFLRLLSKPPMDRIVAIKEITCNIPSLVTDE
jgi:hypothetical protein